MVNPSTLENTEDQVEYLRKCGMKVNRRDDDCIEIRTDKTLSGLATYLVVREEDVGEIVGKVYNGSIDTKDVYDEYVVDHFDRQEEPPEIAQED